MRSTAGWVALLLVCLTTAGRAAEERGLTLTAKDRTEAPPSASPGDRLQVQARTGKPDARYQVGEDLDVQVQPSAAAFVYVVDIGTRGDAGLMFPNTVVADPRVPAGTTLNVPERGRYGMKVEGPAGVEQIVVLAASKSLPVSENLHLIAPRRKAGDLTLARGLRLDPGPPAPGASPAPGSSALPGPSAAPPAPVPSPGASPGASAAPEPGAAAPLDLEIFLGAIEQSAGVSRTRDLAFAVIPVTVGDAGPQSPSVGPPSPPGPPMPVDTRPPRLVVEVTPGGMVYIDGKYRGRDRATIANLSPGSHEVSVQNDGFQPETRMTDLAPGEEKLLKIELKRAP